MSDSDSSYKLTDSPETIWLEAQCAEEHGQRCWAPNNPWGDECPECGSPCVQYVRKDLYDTLLVGAATSTTIQSVSAADMVARLREPKVRRIDAVSVRQYQEHAAGYAVPYADFEAMRSHLLPYKVELLKIAADLGEPNDPFAAWEALRPGFEAQFPSLAHPVQEQAPVDRDMLGRRVREAWVKWARTQPEPKPSWLVPYDELSEPDKEADRQIGEAIYGLSCIAPIGAEAGNGWRTIDSAPKDGSWFLGYRPDLEAHESIDVWHWDANAETDTGPGFWVNAADSNIDEYPTHWQPLLPPPGVAL